jgi:anti-sigma regulatory factor (Ser/Thr protein kinase)
MDDTTGTGRQHADGNSHRAARPAWPGQHRPPATAADVTRVAPFAAQWPLRSFLELGALPSAVPCARLHARQVLWEWGLTACSDSTELLVSELVTNAMQISRVTAQDDPVRLWLVSDRQQVVIFVWDASPLPPAPADVGEDAESGRGLLIVEAASERWGWDFPPALGGKVVWAQTSTK